MYELLDSDQMNEADASTIASGISGSALMKTAGNAVARAAVCMLAEQQENDGRVVIIAGPGNNGGDGAIAAHKLSDGSRPVLLIRFLYDRCVQADALAAYQVYDEAGLEAVDINNDRTSLSNTLKAQILNADLIIDALFGAGLSRPIEGTAAELVSIMNQSAAPVLSVDLPSGLNGNTDQALNDVVVIATRTLTFFRFKPAHFLLPGKAFSGQLELVQIGIEEKVLEAINPSSFLNDPSLWHMKLPQPGPYAHKFVRGNVLVRGGSRMSTGASRLSAQAALQTGAGLVTLASPDDAIDIQASHLNAVMLVRCDSPEHWKALTKDERITALLIGPANGVDEATRKSVETSLRRNTPCVLDADALSAFAQDPDRLIKALKSSLAQVVLTPHTGEFKRVFSHCVDETDSKRKQTVNASLICGAAVIHKGNDTVIASPDGLSRINMNAPPWLATAGSGDVLAGITAALLSQGMSAYDAASAAVWIHGDAAARHGFPMTSENLLEGLRETISALIVVESPSRPIGLDQGSGPGVSGTMS